MATTTPVLLKQKTKADGTIPIYVRICEGNKVKFISTGYSIPKDDWNEKSLCVKNTNSKADVINAVIRKKQRLVDQKELKVLADDSNSSVIQELNAGNKKTDLNDFFKI